MRNPITKAIRYFRREYPFSSGMGLTMTGIGGAVATIASLATGYGFAFIPLMAAGMGGLATLFSGATGENGRPDANTYSLNGFNLVGDRRDIASIGMTQKLITDITQKQQHLAELPAGKQRRIMNNIRDIEQKLARVRVYDSTGAQVSQFSFTRDVIDANGTAVKQVVATTLVMKGEALAPVAPVIESATPAIVQTKPVAPEFGVLAQKVDDVTKRVQQLENPEEPKLEKPKLSAPTA